MILTNFWGSLKNRLSRLVQAPHSTAVNQRLIQMACLTGFVLMACALGVNVFLAMPKPLLLINFLGSVLYAVLYGFSRWQRPRRWMPQALSYSTLGLLHLAWFFNNGLLGPMPLFYPAIAVWGAFVLSSRQLVIFLVTVGLSAVVNILLEFYFPHWLSAYAHPLTQKLDIAMSLGFILLVMSLGLYFFRSIYSPVKDRHIERLSPWYSGASTLRSKVYLYDHH